MHEKLYAGRSCACKATAVSLFYADSRSRTESLQLQGAIITNYGKHLGKRTLNLCLSETALQPRETQRFKLL